MQLIDIGANLTHESFVRDLDAVLDRARAAGVAQMVVTGASREHSPMALELARQHPGFLYATAGVHPHHAVEYTDECDAEMRALHAHPEVVAVGECGLDYNRDFSPRPAQRRAFERQLQIAADLAVDGVGKPLFLHQRDAHDDFLAMMKNFDGGIMGAGEVRYDRYLLFVDLIASKISPNKTIYPAGYPAGVKVDSAAFIGLAAAGYRLIDDPAYSIDAFAGLRGFAMKNTLRVQLTPATLKLSESEQWADGVVGARTKAAIKEFQSLFGLPATGEPDEAVYVKMREIGLTN